MTLWRLEWLRLVRTRRLVALVGIYVFFGIVGPFTARYLGEIVEHFGGEVEITFPDPVPMDGIAQYVGNVTQIGLLVAVAVAAGALVLDARPEMSIFLRTRVHPARRIIPPRYVVASLAVGSAYTLGLAFAWYETAVLLGGLPVGGMVAGLAFHLVYLAFAVAVVAAIGARTTSVVATVGMAVVALLLLPLVGIVEAIGRWLPSHLVGAQLDLLGEQAAAEYLPATAVTILLVAVLVWSAWRGIESREL
ncbi:MAG: hypothetical protein R3244_10680 [Thermoanaerobaculia bacterium]|nr:hypothetical protein [Thermoanaerobaculia bacterium]